MYVYMYLHVCLKCITMYISNHVDYNVYKIIMYISHFFIIIGYTSVVDTNGTKVKLLL